MLHQAFVTVTPLCAVTSLNIAFCTRNVKRGLTQKYKCEKIVSVASPLIPFKPRWNILCTTHIYMGQCVNNDMIASALGS